MQYALGFKNEFKNENDFNNFANNVVTNIITNNKNCEIIKPVAKLAFWNTDEPLNRQNFQKMYSTYLKEDQQNKEPNRIWEIYKEELKTYENKGE